MKRWPLRWKLALYAAALAVVATIAGAATTWAIILSTDAAVRQANRIGWDILLGMLGAIPTVLIVIAIGGRWVARQALAPVEKISQAASRITLQHLEQRLRRQRLRRCEDQRLDNGLQMLAHSVSFGWGAAATGSVLDTVSTGVTIGVAEPACAALPVSALPAAWLLPVAALPMSVEPVFVVPVFVVPVFVVPAPFPAPFPAPVWFCAT